MKLQSIETRYNGQLYRSRTEARWATFFDAAGIRFQYEAEGFVVRSGAYLPDFWLPELKLFFEVKGDEPTDDERQKCADLAMASECDMLLAIGAPEERFQLIWFDRSGERDERYAIARDKFSPAGFWLVAEDGANWIGPNRTTFRPRGPMFSGALEQAFAAARSARFERGDGRQRQPEIVEADQERLAEPAADAA